jgi:hypothetical protein
MLRQIALVAFVGVASLCFGGASGSCQKQVGTFSIPDAPREQMGLHGQTAAIAEIDDPHSGVRWELMRDPNHPGGPGRLTQMPGKENGNGKPGMKVPSRPAPVIRAGDRIAIDEDSSVAVIHLEAVALRPGSIGSDIPVRLKQGGSLFHAVVVGPGRATLALAHRPSMEVQP